jgi:hypothetical protein
MINLEDSLFSGQASLPFMDLTTCSGQAFSPWYALAETAQK